jgi:hypothetical protein
MEPLTVGGDRTLSYAQPHELLLPFARRHVATGAQMLRCIERQKDEHEAKVPTVAGFATG